MSPAIELTRLPVEDDLSRGMFTARAPEKIPNGGAFDITNGLLDEQNVVYRRGGSTYMSATPLGEPAVLLNAFLRSGGQQTVLVTDKGLFRLTASGGYEQIEGFAGFSGPLALQRPTIFEGVIYFTAGITFDGSKRGEATEKRGYYATAGGRLLAGEGSKIAFSQVPAKEGEALTWAEADYHELPEGVRITGMQGFRSSCVVFTTEGIWIISGLEKELTDEEGNIQQTLDRYSPDAVLWGSTGGVAGWSGGLIVPCKDNIWLMELGVSSEKAAPFVHISDPIANVYRSYVAAGYRPGVAAVHHGHYFLPILNGATVIDMLVCRLDATNSRGQHTYPWTHMVGFAARCPIVAITDEDQSFIGAQTGLGRVLTLGFFEPGAGFATDADGSEIPFSVTYRDILTGQLIRNLVAKARLSYRMAAPALSSALLVLSFGDTAFGATKWNEFNWDEANWAAAGGPFEALEGGAPPDPEAIKPHTWRVTRKVRYARVMVSLQGSGATDVSLRQLELFVRQDGRLI